MSFDEFKTKGNEAFKKADYSSAIDHYTSAINISAQKEVFSNRAAAYINLGRFAEASSDADQCISLDPTFVKGYLRKGTALTSMGQHEEAKKIYKEGLSRCGDNAQLLQGMEEATRAASQPPPPTGGPNDLGALFAGMFSPQNIAAVMSDPQIMPLLQDPSFLQKLSEIQSDPSALQRHMQDPKIQTFMTSLIMKMQGNQPPMGTPSEPPKPKSPPKKETPKQPEIPKPAEGTPEWHLEQEKSLGNDLYKKRNFDGAEQHYLKALEHVPNDVLVRLNLASVSLERGNLDECLQRCDEALDTARDTGKFDLLWKAYYKKANAYAKFEQWDLAVEFYEKTLTEKRDREVSLKLRDAKKKLSELKQKQLYDPERSAELKLEANELYKENKVVEAIPKYNEAIKHNNEDHTLYSNRAACYIKLMEFDLALKDCNKAIELSPTFIRAYLRRAQINFGLKKYHKCMEDYEKILEISPENLDALEGIKKTQVAINVLQSGPIDEEHVKRALEDPEIAKIMGDPALQHILQQIQQDPKAFHTYMENPGFRERLNKLVQAGVLRIGR
ncbi:hypothetical protein RCL1_004015 [Eukaryota sp. TZLM3-RCL]